MIHGQSATPAGTGIRLAWRVAILAWLWVVLSNGDAGSWVVGVPAVAVTAAIWLRQSGQRWRLNLFGGLRFARFFLQESMRGGVDVASRVLRPRLRIAPGLLHHRIRLPADGAPRLVFALCVGLLPGTLVVDLGEDALLVHALDASAPALEDVAALECAVAGLFGLELPAAKDRLHV